MFVPRHLVILLSLISLFAAGLPAPARADIPVGTITAGTQPGYGMLALSGFPSAGQPMAVNPVTNKVYVANYGSANVTVIDGATNQPTSIPVGTNPMGVAVNTVTNRIYVTNSFDGTVSVIDGTTGTVTATVTVGTTPAAIAVNPVTNKVYVANFGGSNITVIDAANANVTTDVPVGGSGPAAIAINPLTNRIYVVKYTTNGLAVIEGTTNAVTSVSVAPQLNAVVVNPALNRIYIASALQNTIHAIDGATNASLGSYLNFTSAGGAAIAAALALNPVTATLYTATTSDNSANAFDATATSYTNDTRPPVIATGTAPIGVAVNAITNKAYVVNRGSNNVTAIDGESGHSAVSAGTGATPTAVVVNPVTNRIYVANSGAGTVTVINGTTSGNEPASAQPRAYAHVLTPIAADTTPNDIAINPVTNRIYVASSGGSNVAVIDGSTSVSTGLSLYLTMATTLVPAGTQPTAVAVNALTNVTYVANKGSNDITVIDGSNNATTLSAASFVPALAQPGAIAVNPILNRIYVANTAGTTVTVIDGVNPSSNTAVTVGTHPAAGGTRGLAVDTSTGKVYVANYDSANVTVIDANNNNASTNISLPVGAQPAAVAVNPVSGKVYVANRGSGGNNVTIIDTKNGNVSTTIAVATDPISIAVDVSANQVYVASQSTFGTVVIDGTTNATSTVTGQSNALPVAVAVNPALNKAVVADGNPAGAGTAVYLGVDGPSKRGSYLNRTFGSNGVAVAINPVTNKIYIAAQIAESAGGISANVAQVDQNPAPTIANPLTTSIAPAAGMSGNTTHQSTPSFTFTATSAFSPIPTVPEFVYYQVDSLKGLLRATPGGSPGTFTATMPSLLPGMHILYAFATDGQQSAGGSAFIGKMATYIFFVLQPIAPGAPTIGSAVAGNGSATVSFTPPADDGGAPVTTYTATSSPGGITATGSASSITVTGLTNGTAYTFTVTATNAIGTSLPSDPSNSVTPGIPPAAPTSVAATALDESQVEINFSPVTGASGYKVLRSSMNGAYLPIGTYPTAAPVLDGGLASDTTYLYRVRALNGAGESPDSPMDPATTIVFTNANAIGAMAVVAHINELRTAVNAMRAAVGQSAASFTDPTLLAGATLIKAVHITELRTALDAARSALLLSGIVYTDPTITPQVTVMKAAHIIELRNGTQ